MGIGLRRVEVSTAFNTKLMYRLGRFGMYMALKRPERFTNCCGGLNEGLQQNSASNQPHRVNRTSPAGI